MVINGVWRAGAAVITIKQTVQGQTLPHETSTQRAELIALIWALQEGKHKELANKGSEALWKYAFSGTMQFTHIAQPSMPWIIKAPVPEPPQVNPMPPSDTDSVEVSASQASLPPAFSIEKPRGTTHLSHTQQQSQVVQEHRAASPCHCERLRYPESNAYKIQVSFGFYRETFFSLLTLTIVSVQVFERDKILETLDTTLTIRNERYVSRVIYCFLIVLEVSVPPEIDMDLGFSLELSHCYCPYCCEKKSPYGCYGGQEDPISPDTVCKIPFDEEHKIKIFLTWQSLLCETSICYYVDFHIFSIHLASSSDLLCSGPHLNSSTVQMASRHMGGLILNDSQIHMHVGLL
ncbi:PREDICTED: uncharacterized protein LOC106148861 [Chinchilla lanigera]|uniref:uncharacterized protein LOC106148861 n=1 Tax=Chinchilla lanigera TaxID=34839 RepID=UPI00069723D6|nr:PREDICTED: uncharacterized protein LOC106148861 [Chinchilla lanigera]